MKFSELIDCCIECIKSFNPIIKTIDSHADDFLKDVSSSNIHLKQYPFKLYFHLDCKRLTPFHNIVQGPL